MLICSNCVHCDVCDTNCKEIAQFFGVCTDFLNDSIVVEIVECEKCKYYHQGVITRCTNPKGLKAPSNDAYCSYGELRGEDDETTV